MKTRSENIEVTICRRRILFAGIVTRMEGIRLPKGVIFGKLMGRADCVEGYGKKVDGMSPGRPKSFRYQHRLVDDCNPGRGGMAQDA